MRRPLAMILTALFSASLVAVTGNTPASAVNVRYQASKSCTVDGQTFSAHILTYGRPTEPNTFTEVQLWGYKYERGMRAQYVEARTVVWRDGSWQDAGSGPGWEADPPADGEWHRGDNQGGPQWIGYITADRPKAILVRGFTKGEIGHEHFCYVVLRPYDLKWIG